MSEEPTNAAAAASSLTRGRTLAGASSAPSPGAAPRNTQPAGLSPSSKQSAPVRAKFGTLSCEDATDGGERRVLPSLFDIDFVGTGNFRASQVDLRLRRTVDLARTPAAVLSSRGLQHRQGRKAFAKDVRAASAVIG
jgi:hypothetical protein